MSISLRCMSWDWGEHRSTMREPRSIGRTYKFHKHMVQVGIKPPNPNDVKQTMLTSKLKVFSVSASTSLLSIVHHRQVQQANLLSEVFSNRQTTNCGLPSWRYRGVANPLPRVKCANTCYTTSWAYPGLNNQLTSFSITGGISSPVLNSLAVDEAASWAGKLCACCVLTWAANTQARRMKRQISHTCPCA